MSTVISLDHVEPPPPPPTGKLLHGYLFLARPGGEGGEGGGGRMGGRGQNDSSGMLISCQGRGH
jgi:hypothetical protein